jgi:ketol-acid reductoisomerase
MMEDWAAGDKNLLKWRKETGESAFEKAKGNAKDSIKEQEYFDNGILMIAFVKAGVELAFETMIQAGILEESAYYESLHEVPLIANTISRKKLYEMNVVISDTAEYGNYLFSNSAIPLLKDYVDELTEDVIGMPAATSDYGVDNRDLIEVNDFIRNHPIEYVGAELRGYMTEMKAII